MRVFLLLLALAVGAPAAPASEYTDAGSSKRPVPRLTPYQKLVRKIDSAILWNVDPSQPVTRIEIHLAENMLYAFQGDLLVAQTLVSHGRPGHQTPTGHYTVLEKDPDHRSTEYGSWVRADESVANYQAKEGDLVPAGLHYEAAPMPWFLRLTADGVGLHAGFVTGTPLSHGCIRLPLSFAQQLYLLVAVGTPVIVSP